MDADSSTTESWSARFLITDAQGKHSEYSLEEPTLMNPSVLYFNAGQTSVPRVNSGFVPTTTGKVEVQLVLTNERNPSLVIRTNKIAISIAKVDESTLRTTCEELGKAITTAKNTEESLELASELALIHDPVALPTIRKQLVQRSAVEGTLIHALRYIPTEEALDVLSAVVGRADVDMRRYALSTVEDIAVSTTSDTIRQKAHLILAAAGR